MSLASACPDRGRIIRAALTTDPDPPQAVVRVEGRKQYTAPDPTDPQDLENIPQFKCRLELPGESESQTGGMRRTFTEPTLIVVKRDLTGQPVQIKNSDQILVESRELGTDTWNVMGDPQPLRRRRSIIGWQVTLSRVEADTKEQN